MMWQGVGEPRTDGGSEPIGILCESSIGLLNKGWKSGLIPLLYTFVQYIIMHVE